MTFAFEDICIQGLVLNMDEKYKQNYKITYKSVDILYSFPKTKIKYDTKIGSILSKLI